MTAALAAPGASGAPSWWAWALRGLGTGRMDPVAYDTAWLARVRTAGGDLAFPGCWDWLGEHQHPDGSWGAAAPWGADRAAATAAALVALAEAARDGLRPVSPSVIALGRRALESHLADLAAGGPPGGGATLTVGLEFCLPALLEEARALGLAVPAAPEALVRRGRAKLARLPAEWRQHPPPSLCHSLEGWAGGQVPAGLLDESGSCANSPSATAYHQMRRPHRAALRYLRGACRGGGAVDVRPFEVFETAWVLDFLALAGADLRAPAFGAHADLLQAAMRPDGTAGISAHGIEPDADDTALALVALARAGRPAAAEALRGFERDAGFACFPFERDPSVSANVHVAYAALRVPGAGRASVLAKVLSFLADARLPGGYWVDKWHLSPYYPTGRAVLALGRVAPDLVAPARLWLLESQRPDGGWGLAGSTPEETAYAVFGLAAPAAPHPAEALARAAAYLRGAPAGPALWIGKGLYHPRLVTEAAAAAALQVARRWAR